MFQLPGYNLLLARRADEKAEVTSPKLLQHVIPFPKFLLRQATHPPDPAQACSPQ